MTSSIFNLDSNLDEKIREHLRQLDAKNRLGDVAYETGIGGGVIELRRIMNSTGELHIMDRGMLSILLRLHDF